MEPRKSGAFGAGRSGHLSGKAYHWRSGSFSRAIIAIITSFNFDLLHRVFFENSTAIFPQRSVSLNNANTNPCVILTLNDVTTCHAGPDSFSSLPQIPTMAGRPQVGIERLPARRMSNEPRESMNCKSCRKRKVSLGFEEVFPLRC